MNKKVIFAIAILLVGTSAFFISGRDNRVTLTEDSEGLIFIARFSSQLATTIAPKSQIYFVDNQGSKVKYVSNFGEGVLYHGPIYAIYEGEIYGRHFDSLPGIAKYNLVKGEETHLFGEDVFSKDADIEDFVIHNDKLYYLVIPSRLQWHAENKKLGYGRTSMYVYDLKSKINKLIASDLDADSIRGFKNGTKLLYVDYESAFQTMGNTCRVKTLHTGIDVVTNTVVDKYEIDHFDCAEYESRDRPKNSALYNSQFSKFDEGYENHTLLHLSNGLLAPYYGDYSHELLEGRTAVFRIQK